jgi:IS30 family transposase
VVRGKLWRRVTPEVRRAVMGLAAGGLSETEIVSRVDISRGSTYRILRPLGGVIRADMLEVTGRRLSLEERVEIRVGLEAGRSMRAIAAGLGRAASTVCREVNANGGRGGYRPVGSHRRAHWAAQRPKPTKLGANPVLCARVIAELERLWSPEQIARGLRAEFGAGSVEAVSHETIYKSLYIQGRGELRRELTRCLRSGRAVRHSRGRLEKRGRIPGMVNISERPAEADDRAVPGHWEGDLIVGKNSRSWIATLVERSTRYVMLAAVSTPTAEVVTEALVAAVGKLPEHLWRSLAWDQGSEMTGHARFTIATDIPVFFCDPHSPWQRGSNENTNGLLRQYFPKGTDLSVHDQHELDRVAVELNSRPRLTLGDQTPAQRLAPLLDPQAA